MRAVVAGVVLLVALAACERPAGPVVFYEAGNVPQRLSEWGIVFADGRQLSINENVIPYELNTPLFSDYALKLRTVSLPEGTVATYDAEHVFDFPVGTIFTKTFHYEKAQGWSPTDNRVIKSDRESALDESVQLDLDDYVLIETRLLVHEESGWSAYPYVWNAEQTEAFLELAGDLRSVTLSDADALQTITYVVPDANQCANCHTPDHTSRALQPIGPKAWQLNRSYSWWGDASNQLARWTAEGLLAGYTGTAAAGVSWSAPGDATLEARAKAYLDANCAHCHNPAGAADTSGLHLNIDAPVDRLYGICKTPVAVGRGSGGRPVDIYPGRPQDSILVFRMQDTDPAIAMPELGRSAVHEQGVRVVSDWIASLNGDCATGSNLAAGNRNQGKLE